MCLGSILPVPCRLDDTDVVQTSKGSLSYSPFAGFSASPQQLPRGLWSRFKGNHLLPVTDNNLAVTITTTAVVIVLALRRICLDRFDSEEEA